MVGFHIFRAYIGHAVYFDMDSLMGITVADFNRFLLKLFCKVLLILGVNGILGKLRHYPMHIGFCLGDIAGTGKIIFVFGTAIAIFMESIRFFQCHPSLS